MTRPIISKNTYYSGGLKAMSRLLFSNDDAPVFSYVAVAWADDIALGLGSQNVGSKSKAPACPSCLMLLTPGMICVSFILVMNS